MSLVIAPRGFLDRVVGGVIKDIDAFGNSTTLLLVTFEDSSEMLFPGPPETGGNWSYPKGLEPGMTVSGAWQPNPEWEDGADVPKAFFTLTYDDDLGRHIMASK